MRLLMLDNEFPPLGGGTAVVNLHLLRELARADDVEVDLVTSHGERRKERVEEQFAARIRIIRVPVDNRDPHHARHRELLRYAGRGLLACRELLRARRYDAAFAFSGLPAGAMALVLKHSHGLPYLVSLQGRDVPGFDPAYRRVYPFLAPLIRRVWREAAVVTSISDEQRRLAARTWPELRTHVVHNGVDVDLFSPPARGPGGEEVNVLSVARLIPRKGHRFLLAAIAALRRDGVPVRLTLAGQGDAEPSLRRLAAELGISDAVSFLGFVSRDRIADVYRAAHVFVLPSENEGMSIALLEAMASSLPVVVTFVGGTAELVEDGANGFVVPFGEPAALAAAIGQLAAAPETRARMARANRLRARGFSWRSFAERHLQLCAEAAATAPSQAHRRGAVAAHGASDP